MSLETIRQAFNREALQKEELEVFYAEQKEHGAEGIGRIPILNHSKSEEARKNKEAERKLDQ